MSIVFLELDEILEIHEDQIIQYGGDPGLRDAGLLISAVETARVTFGGELLHGDVALIAAAYLFHLVSNHPFVDGNKRTGAVAALVFFSVNGIDIEIPDNDLYELVMAVARAEMSKDRVAAALRSHLRTAE